MKTKAIQALEERLGEIGEDSERGRVLHAAKQFKSNWVELGQKLARVMEEKLFLEWGFASFDQYVKGELQLKLETALKLVRSFSLVREARPALLTPERQHEIPAMDVVDFLSRKRDEAPAKEWQAFSEEALTEAWSPRTVSQKWRDLVGDERTAAPKRDPAERAVFRARDLAERLQRSLAEIPGLDDSVIDAAQAILAALESASQAA
jgi:hypothetical protein